MINKEKMAYKYIKIVQISNEIYKIWNVIYEEYVGEIKRARVGRWMHWCFFPYKDTWFSNGCLKEISKSITSLYSEML